LITKPPEKENKWGDRKVSYRPRRGSPPISSNLRGLAFSDSWKARVRKSRKGHHVEQVLASGKKESLNYSRIKGEKSLHFPAEKGPQPKERGGRQTHRAASCPARERRRVHTIFRRGRWSAIRPQRKTIKRERGNRRERIAICTVAGKREQPH